MIGVGYMFSIEPYLFLGPQAVRWLEISMKDCAVSKWAVSSGFEGECGPGVGR